MENCPDLRNTKVVDVLAALREYGMEPLVVDPWVDPEEARREYGLEVWQQLLEPGGVLLDLKGIVPRQLAPLRL